MILEVNGQRIKVDESFRRLSPEQQQATVEEIATNLPAPNDPNTKMGFLNRGLANVLGAPVDIVTSGLNLIPGVEIQDPVGGSANLQSGMRTINADVANREAETFVEHTFEGVGEGAGALLPVLSASRAMQGAQGATAAVASQMSAPFVSQPIRATAAELAAGGGAKAAGYGADQLAEDGDAGPVARMVAELAGGLAAAAGPGAAIRTGAQLAEKLPVSGAIIRGTKAAVAPFTDAGGRVRAENRVQSLVTDPQSTAERMMQDNPGNLTPAQLANDPNLLALESTVASQNPAIRDDLAARASESSAALQRSYLRFATEGTPQNTSDFLTRRRTQFRERLEGFRQRAEERADERIRRLDPTRQASENSLIVREEIDRAYDRALQQERALWSNVPKSVEVPTDNVREAYATVLAETSRARLDDIPREAFALLGEDGFARRETVQEMHGLYSQLRQRAREALGRSTPNPNKARIANELADAILVDLGATGGMPTAVGNSINEARTFSREMNEVFRQGAVRNFTARSSLGGPMVPPETALSRSLNQTGPRAAVAVDQISGAAGEAAMEPLQDYMRGRLMDRATGRRGYDPAQAEAFERANSETLSRFPNLHTDMADANAMVRTSQARAERVDAIVGRLNNPRLNAGAALINATPGDEIAQAIFKAKDPTQAARALRQETSKDSTGRALGGVQRGVLDFLIGRASGRFAADGTQNISGNQLFGDLQNPQHRAVLATLFEPAEIQRMERIAKQFQGLEASRNARTLDAVIDDTPNQIIGFVANTLAARQGARAGQGVSGASLLTANFASRKMRQIMSGLTNDRAERLIQDAITDRDLFVALMTRNTDAAGMRHAENRLAEWITGTFGVVLPVSEEEDA